MAVAVVAGLVNAMPAWTPALRDTAGAALPNSVASVEPIELDGVRQWLEVGEVPSGPHFECQAPRGTSGEEPARGLQ